MARLAGHLCAFRNTFGALAALLGGSGILWTPRRCSFFAARRHNPRQAARRKDEGGQAYSCLFDGVGCAAHRAVGVAGGDGNGFERLRCGD